MKLLIKDVLTLHEALQALNGKQIVVKKDDKDVTIFEQYDFGPNVRWAIAKNIKILSEEINIYQSTRDSVIVAITNGGNQIDPNNSEQINKFLVTMEELGRKEVDIPFLLTINLKDLKVDENKLLPSLLLGLMPLIVE